MQKNYIKPNKMKVRQFYYTGKWDSKEPYYQIFLPNGHYTAAEWELNKVMKYYWDLYYET